MKMLPLVLLAAIMIPVHAEPGKKRVYRDVATHEDLAAINREMVVNEEDPFKALEVSEGPDPMVESRPVDLVKRSDVICFGGLMTLVPKRAILHIPDAYRGVIGVKTGQNLVSWTDFFARNRSWIETFEVKWETAEGSMPIPAEMHESFIKSKKLVVATLLGGPISVLPPKEIVDEEAPVAAETTTEP